MYILPKRVEVIWILIDNMSGTLGMKKELPFSVNNLLDVNQRDKSPLTSPLNEKGGVISADAEWPGSVLLP